MRPFTLVHCSRGDYSAALRTDARAGFTSGSHRLPSRWCFDDRGRSLFTSLFDQSGPHLFTAEAALLSGHAESIAATGARQLIQIGPQSLWQLDVLTERLVATGNLTGIAICDTPHGSPDATPAPATADLADVEHYHVVADLPGKVPPLPGQGGRLLVLPMAMFASLETADRQALLAALRKRCATGDQLLVTTPESQSLSRQVDFFNDAGGIAAAFNRNVLNVVNHMLDSDINDDAFAHVVTYDGAADRLDLRLRSRNTVRLELRTLGFHLDLAPGDELRTFALSGFGATDVINELSGAGFAVGRQWRDPESVVRTSLATAS